MCKCIHAYPHTWPGSSPVKRTPSWKPRCTSDSDPSASAGVSTNTGDHWGSCGLPPREGRGGCATQEWRGERDREGVLAVNGTALTVDLSLASAESTGAIFFLRHPNSVNEVTGPTCSFGPHTKWRLVVTSGSGLPVRVGGKVFRICQ